MVEGIVEGVVQTWAQIIFVLIMNQIIPQSESVGKPQAGNTEVSFSCSNFLVKGDNVRAKRSRQLFYGQGNCFAFAEVFFGSNSKACL